MDVLERSATPIWATSVAAAGVVLITLVNPFMYQTVLFDVHLEPTAALFLLLAGRDLWNGRFRRAWVFAGIVLLCGSLAAIGVIALGLSATLAGRSTRRHGLFLTGCGPRMDPAHQPSSCHPSLQQRIRLPGRPKLASQHWRCRGPRWSCCYPSAPGRPSAPVALYRYLGPCSACRGDRPGQCMGFGVPAALILANALNVSPVFIGQGFQNFAVFPFVLVGTVMVLCWIATQLQLRPPVVWLVGLIGLVIITEGLVFGIGRSPVDVRGYLAQRVEPAQAAQLQSALAKTPNSAEVISVLSVMGRFCGRPSCYYFNFLHPVPVKSADVVFVIAPNYQGASAELVQRSIAYIRDNLNAPATGACRWRDGVGVATATGNEAGDRAVSRGINLTGSGWEAEPRWTMQRAAGERSDLPSSRRPPRLV